MKDQRVYFFNTKEIVGNKYGTANPVPFRVVDRNIGLDVDIAIKCFGEYSYKLTDPMLFYKNVCGNISADYTRDRIDSQLKSEVLTALQPAFAKISALGIRYSAVPGHTAELAEALNEALSQKWGAAGHQHRLHRRELGHGQRRGRGDDQGAAAQRRSARSAHGRRASRRRTGGGHEIRRRQRRRHGRRRRVLWHEHGAKRRRRERPEPVPDGTAAARSAGAAVPAGAGRKLGLFLRYEEYGKILLRMRQAAHRSASLPLRQMRLGTGGRGATAEVLPGVRRPL